MNDLYIFQHYPFEEGPIPHHFDTNFDYCYELARSHLKNRSVQDIIQLSQDIDRYIVQQLPAELFRSDFPQCILDEPTLLYPNRMHLTIFTGLKREGGSPTEFSRLPGLTWIECYAAVIFANIVMAVVFEKKFEIAPDALPWQDLAENIGHFAIACAEFALLINMLRPEGAILHPEIFLPAIKERKSEIGRQAAAVRHAPAQGIKDDFIAWYEEHASSDKFKSKAQAAQQFHRQLPDHDQRTVTDTNTLLRALRKHLKA